jgi:hypothetical protein
MLTIMHVVTTAVYLATVINYGRKMFVKTASGKLTKVPDVNKGTLTQGKGSVQRTSSLR